MESLQQIMVRIGGIFKSSQVAFNCQSQAT